MYIVCGAVGVVCVVHYHVYCLTCPLPLLQVAATDQYIESRATAMESIQVRGVLFGSTLWHNAALHIIHAISTAPAATTSAIYCHCNYHHCSCYSATNPAVDPTDSAAASTVTPPLLPPPHTDYDG
jgi:hypothetical protein